MYARLVVVIDWSTIELMESKEISVSPWLYALSVCVEIIERESIEGDDDTLGVDS